MTRETRAVLELRRLSDSLQALRSPRLDAAGVAHAFSTRFVDDATEPLTLSASLQLPCERFVSATQVHGSDVYRPPPRGEEPEERPRADALVTDRRGDLLAISTADCVPILVASSDGREVAAIHAGWRGLLAGVIGAALSEMSDRPMVAAVGPCLSTERFEVGPEVARRFESAGWRRHVLDDGFTRPRIDLRSVAREALRAAGVTAIDVAAECTWDDDALFFSHRRDVTHGPEERTGRQIAFIAPRASA